MLRKTIPLAGVALCAALSTARADESDAPSKAPAASAAGVQLTLPDGRLVLDAFAEISLSSGAVFKPFSLTPDVWYGATSDITVGLVHSTLGATGFIGQAGDSLCLTGTSGNCGDLYHNVGLDVRYKLSPNTVVWAVDGGLFFNNLSPAELAIKLGVVGRWTSDKLVIEFQPNLFIGLTNRTVDLGNGATATINGEVLNVPVTALYPVANKLDAAVQLGVHLPFEGAGDNFTIPLSLGAHYTLDESTMLTAAFSLPRLIAGSFGGVDARSITLGGTYAF